MLSQEKILDNKNKFIKLIESIERPNCLIKELISKLERSDFFSAPASTQYHCSYEGGLCEHSLHVYEQLTKLINIEYNESPFTKDTIIIVSLLHDISKMNFYEIATRNTKDEKGNWIQVPFIKTKDVKERFIYGNHEENSLFMVQQFIPLTIEECVAINKHMGGKAYDSSQEDISPIYNKYSLAVLLHTADMLATFIDERE